jgi:CheY-like chemotaxis protein
MDKPVRILIVEDLLTDAEPVQRHVRRTLPDRVFEQAETREAYLAALERFQPNLFISGYHMPHLDGMAALQLEEAIALNRKLGDRQQVA